MNKAAAHWTLGGIVAIVVMTVSGHPIAALMGMLVSGLFIHWWEGDDT